MYGLFHLIENINKVIRIKFKILYWKLKYGKRIKIGKGLRFRKSLIINITKDGYLEIGNGCFFNNVCSINCHKRIKIGDDNIFGENVKIYDHNHVFNDKKINRAKTFNSRPIDIGNNNWFGSNVIILSKSAIGDNNVIAAGTVVNTAINSDALVSQKNEIKIEQIKYR